MSKLTTLLKFTKNYLNQFSKLTVIKILFLDIISKILDPYLIYSYSQTGEDRIIHSIIEIYGKWEKIDFSSNYYVEVGCNEPIKYSNTYSLYKNGWRGLCIDGNETLIRQFEKVRPHDICVCAVVSNSSDEITFTEFTDSGVSSVNPQHIEEWTKYSTIASQRRVNPTSLQTILDSHQVPKNFALLSVDVEGHDLEVLLSLDFNIYRPALIVVEMTGFNLSNISESGIFKYLSEYGYRLIAFVIGNAYFLAPKFI